MRILRGLRQEGTEPTLVLWGINKDLHWLARVEYLVRQGRSPDDAMNAEYVWRPRQAAMRQALSRLKAQAILALLSDAARVDRATIFSAIAIASSIRSASAACATRRRFSWRPTAIISACA